MAVRFLRTMKTKNIGMLILILTSLAGCKRSFNEVRQKTENVRHDIGGQISCVFIASVQTQFEVIFWDDSFKPRRLIGKLYVERGRVVSVMPTPVFPNDVLPHSSVFVPCNLTAFSEYLIYDRGDFEPWTQWTWFNEPPPGGGKEKGPLVLGIDLSDFRKRRVKLAGQLGHENTTPHFAYLTIMQNAPFERVFNILKSFAETRLPHEIIGIGFQVGHP
jgi:hypothetical protein